jgi:hypothetical protein
MILSYRQWKTHPIIGPNLRKRVGAERSGGGVVNCSGTMELMRLTRAIRPPAQLGRPAVGLPNGKD